MKISLCISGGLRNFKDTHYSFERYLLSAHNVDVFFYGLENKEGRETNSKDLDRLYSPKIKVINTQEYYSNIQFPHHKSSSSYTNAFYSFYNIYMCNELKKKYENENGFKYDLVIRSRLDYFWFRYIKEKELELAKNNIMIPADWAFKCVNPYARADVFAFGSSELMDRYSSMFNRIDDYVNKIGMFHPESICGYHLMVNEISNIENERCVVFEYPCKKLEKFIHPYKHFMYFDTCIEDEQELGRVLCNKRKDF